MKRLSSKIDSQLVEIRCGSVDVWLDCYTWADACGEVGQVWLRFREPNVALPPGKELSILVTSHEGQLEVREELLPDSISMEDEDPCADLSTWLSLADSTVLDVQHDTSSTLYVLAGGRFLHIEAYPSCVGIAVGSRLEEFRAARKKS